MRRSKRSKSTGQLIFKNNGSGGKDEKIFGAPGEFPRALLMGAGWVINLAMVEWIIRKRLAHPTRTSPVAA